MEVAIHTSCLSGHNLESALEISAELGYQSIELAADISETPHFQSHLATVDEITALESLLERTNLKLAAIDIGGWDSPLCLVNLDDGERKVAVQHVAHSIQTAGALDCALITTHLWGLPAAEARMEPVALPRRFPGLSQRTQAAPIQTQGESEFHAAPGRIHRGV